MENLLMVMVLEKLKNSEKAFELCTNCNINLKKNTFPFLLPWELIATNSRLELSSKKITCECKVDLIKHALVNEHHHYNN